MIERFLKQTKFTSEQDFKEHLEFIIPEDFNFAYDVMDEWAKIKPDHVALLWASERGEEIRFTYKDLKEQSDKAAAYFQSLGIGHDDKVMLILKRHYQWWLAMLGLHKLGAVAIPATHMLTKHDIVYRNNAASVKAIICCGDDYVVEQVNQAMPESPTVKTLISIGPDIPEGFHDWMKEWNECAPFVRPEHVNSNEDTLLMYFTSGTTGEPKMVAHDHLYALGHLTTGVYWHNLHENSIHLTVADTGWGKAVWGKLYGQWFAGATVFVFDHEKFTADKIMRQIEKYHITSFCAPPTIYRFMIQEDFSKYDLSSLEYCTTAGEAMNPSVAETFQKLTGVQIYEGFGQTETTMTLGTFPWIKPKPGSMGKPNPQYDVHILRPDMTECEDGEKGEICIRIGDDKPIGLFKYYYRDEKQTKSVWHDGYYHTGDMAWRDEEGYFWFEGRIDDVIKSSGYRIGPFEVLVCGVPYHLCLRVSFRCISSGDVFPLGDHALVNRFLIVIRKVQLFGLKGKELDSVLFHVGADVFHDLLGKASCSPADDLILIHTADHVLCGIVYTGIQPALRIAEGGVQGLGKLERILDPP